MVNIKTIMLFSSTGLSILFYKLLKIHINSDEANRCGWIAHRHYGESLKSLLLSIIVQ